MPTLALTAGAPLVFLRPRPDPVADPIRAMDGVLDLWGIDLGDGA